MQIKDNEVYIWEENGAILGFCKVSINGINEEFGAGYAIEDKKGNIVKHALAKNRAIRQVKIQMANVMDALKLYGDKILDKFGNIDQQEFLKQEKAIQRNKAKTGLVDLEEKEVFTKLKDLKINMIDSNQANELGIGDGKTN